MSDHTDLTALVHRAQQLAAQAQAQVARSSLLPVDEKEVALGNYRTIAGLCARTIERLRPQGGPVPPETVEAVQALIQIARLCTNEHDRISQADAARREHARRWSEVHDEFEAAQREGRPMRSDWSWERHARWEGEIA
jgi:hypothetical protein